MKSQLKVLIACGSGIATSTVAQERVKEILAEAGIPATMVKGTIGQVQAMQHDVDVVMTTTRYPKPLDKPLVMVFGLISGIGEDKVKQQIIDTCREALAQG